MEGVIGPRSGDAGESQAPASPISAKLTQGWRQHFKAKQAKTAILITVPSGQDIIAERMPLSYMLKAGYIPDRLSTAVEKQIALITAGDPKASEKAMVEEYKEDPKKSDREWKDVLDFIWMNCVVLPKFVADVEANPDDETDPTFPVGSVDLIDKVYLYEWCQGVNETIAAFLESTSAIMGTLADEYGISLSSEQLVLPDQPGGFLAGIST